MDSLSHLVDGLESACGLSRTPEQQESSNDHDDSLHHIRLNDRVEASHRRVGHHDHENDEDGMPVGNIEKCL